MRQFLPREFPGEAEKHLAMSRKEGTSIDVLFCDLGCKDDWEPGDWKRGPELSSQARFRFHYDSLLVACSVTRGLLHPR